MLPLLEALRGMKPERRVIVLSHLDGRTRDGIYETVAHVLQNEKLPLAKRLKLKEKLYPFKRQFRYLASPSARHPRKKRRALAQVGGGPMSHVLRAAIPMLLDTFPR